MRETDLPVLAVRMIAVFVSVLGHELGHAFAVRYFKGSPSITLHGMGGVVTYFDVYDSKQKIIIAGAGPLFGAVMAGVAGGFLLFPLPWLFGELVFALFWINTVWTIFNLLPIFPMDGGQILRESLGAARIKLSHQIGIGVAIVGALVMFGVFRQIFAALMLVFFAYSNYTELKKLS